jgi:oligopeptide transport system ATP-binding protein
MAEPSGSVVRDAAANIVEVRELRKVFGRDFVAVDDVEFAVPRGGSLAIVGESGSGKTTVARMIVGLERPTSGTIVVDGIDRSLPARSAKERRARGRAVQIVFQDPYSSLDPRQTVAASINEVLTIHGLGTATERDARVKELASLVGLDDRQVRARPRALSGGQRQRVAIARALAVEPQVLILDESVAALDVSIQAQVLNLLADIREQTGVTYILISHDLAVVRQITQQAVVMHRGRIVERGPTAQILDDPQQDYTKLLRASVPGPGWQPRRRTTA